MIPGKPRLGHAQQKPQQIKTPLLPDEHHRRGNNPQDIMMRAIHVRAKSLQQKLLGTSKKK
jgi:hypothetical protein